MKNKLAIAISICLFLLSGFISISVAQHRSFVESIHNRPFIHNPRNGYHNNHGQHDTYRSIDGTNNNIGNNKEEWGSTDIVLYRELAAQYATSDPRNAMNGTNRPSARQISNVLCDEPVTQFSSRNLSAFVYVWGQFLDHDITLTPTGSTESVPVVLPINEPLFTEPIPFSRSEVRSGTGITNARQQSNLNTAWIDASVVYGSDPATALWLRTMNRGKLKTSSGNLLPWNTVTGQQTGAIDHNAPSMANDADHTVKTYVAGDVRASEHPGILALHTMFVREHNRICDRLRNQGYNNDEQIYQKARKEVGAIIQAITYQEFLPAIGISLSSYNGYNSNTRPDITNTFATAGYRLGHTMVADEIALRDNDCYEVAPGDFDLADVFFTPQLIPDYGIEPFLKGFSTHKQYETDNKINSVLRNFLFGNVTDPVRFGIDLAALNIQRGRDHGLPDYNSVRQYYLGQRVNNFSQITSDPIKAAALQSLYGNVNNIDLWVGLLAEDRMNNKSVGRTINAMLKSQFEKLRDGDYYFYRNDPFLSSSIRNQVINTKLSDVIRRNTTLTNMQNNVFFIDPCPGEDGEDRLRAQVAIENSEIRVYPNPVSDVLNIDWTNLEVASTIQLFSSGGMLLKTINRNADENLIQLDASGFAPGAYYMIINSGNEKKSFRFMKIN